MVFDAGVFKAEDDRIIARIEAKAEME